MNNFRLFFKHFRQKVTAYFASDDVTCDGCKLPLTSFLLSKGMVDYLKRSWFMNMSAKDLIYLFRRKINLPTGQRNNLV